jgi:hypothetical protein
MVAPNDLIFSPRWWPITAWAMKGEVVAQSPSQPDMLSVNMWTFCLTTYVWNGWASLFLDLCWTSVWDCPIQVHDGVCFIHICSKLSRPVFQYGFQSSKKNVLNPDLAESEDVCLHITQKSSGNPLCDPLHDPSWLRGPALVISMARKCPIYGPSDHVQLRWARDLYLKNPWIQGILTCINHSDQGEVPKLDGAFNEKVIDLNEGFPASHVSVPEGMI